ncbi:unnamed protein product [Heterobilharzia americana]|nr:unnamed protein product [Heterobilharzia americana]
MNEYNYPQTEKEVLSIIYAVTYFNQYLFGQHFEIHTTHSPLLELLAESKSIPQIISARIQRWALLLSTYNYTLRYIEMKNNLTAHALSRLPTQDNSQKGQEPSEILSFISWINSFEIIVGKIRKHVDLDNILSQIKIYVMTGWPKYVDEKYKPYQQRKHEITLKNGCLLYGTRIIIPTNCREAILGKLHTSHTTNKDMKESAMNYVWWPEINDDIDRTVQQCDVCQLNKSSTAVVNKSLLQPIKASNKTLQRDLWTKLHIGYFGPVHGYMLFMVIDTCTKWIEIKTVRKATNENTIKSLCSIFASHGIPQYLLSDNSQVFTCKEFQKYLHQNNITHVITDIHDPSTNELTNIAVEIVKRGFQKQNVRDFHKQLENFVFLHRITPQNGEKLSPAELLMGRRLRLPTDFLNTDSDDIGTKTIK